MKHSLRTAALFFGIAVLFASAAAGSGGPGTKAVRVVLNGTGASAPAGNVGADGQCINTGDPWLDGYTCSGSGNCTCDEVTALKLSGSGLKSVTDFFVTDDKGINPATEPTVGSGPSPKCSPALGILTVTDKSGDSTTINFLGVSCKHVIGISSTNLGGTHDKDLLSGGWGISDTPAPTIPTSGWGTLTGTVTKTTNAVSVKLSGWVTQ